MLRATGRPASAAGGTKDASPCMRPKWLCAPSLPGGHLLDALVRDTEKFGGIPDAQPQALRQGFHGSAKGALRTGAAFLCCFSRSSGLTHGILHPFRQDYIVLDVDAQPLSGSPQSFPDAFARAFDRAPLGVHPSHSLHCRYPPPALVQFVPHHKGLLLHLACLSAFIRDFPAYPLFLFTATASTSSCRGKVPGPARSPSTNPCRGPRQHAPARSRSRPRTAPE